MKSIFKHKGKAPSAEVYEAVRVERCPFCGGKPVISYRNGFMIKCGGECGVEMGVVMVGSKIEGDYLNCSSLIEMWNKRTVKE